MKISKFLSFLMVVVALSFTNAYAAKLYRHILSEPLHISLKADDTLIIDYDFSEKTGIRCTTNSDRPVVNFTYKGRQKSAYLPIVLQSGHVPEQAGEELADASGQFSVAFSKNQTNNAESSEINCQYI